MNEKDSEIVKKREQNALSERMIQEYTKLQKEKEDLIEKFNKQALVYGQEIDSEREKNKKLSVENGKLQKIVRELKNDIMSQEQKLVKKDQEIVELQKRLDTKLQLDDKSKDRDQNIFMKFLGRKPVSSNSQDQKLVTILNYFENQREKLEKENAGIKKECENLREALENNKQEKGEAIEEDNRKLKFQEKVKDELILQVSSLQEERDNLFLINQTITRQKENLYKEFKAQGVAHAEMKELYKQLRIEFQATVHRQQEQYLQLQRANHQSNETSNDSHILSQQPKNQSSTRSQALVSQNQQFYEQADIEDSQKKGKDEESEVIQKLKEIYLVDSSEEIVQCAQKTELVMQAIPKMEALLEAISDIIFANQQDRSVDRIIPTLQQWEADIRHIDMFIQFKDQLCQSLNLLPDSSTDRDIFSRINSFQNKLEELRHEVNQLQNRENTFKEENNIPKVCEHEKQFMQVVQLMKALELGDDANSQEKIKQILLQLSDIQRFLKITKKLLDLDQEMRADAVLSFILKLLEKIKMNKFADPDLTMKILKILKVEDPIHIIPKIEEMQKSVRKCNV